MGICTLEQSETQFLIHTRLLRTSKQVSHYPLTSFSFLEIQVRLWLHCAQGLIQIPGWETPQSYLGHRSISHSWKTRTGKPQNHINSSSCNNSCKRSTLVETILRMLMETLYLIWTILSLLDTIMTDWSSLATPLNTIASFKGQEIWLTVRQATSAIFCEKESCLLHLQEPSQYS